MSIAEFARRINCDRTTVYYTFEKKTIDIEQLELISKVLGYDFIRNVYL
jgi:AcrR family transcriptional regulator